MTLAQWALESGWGTSGLAVMHNNFAGLKWRPEMEGSATRVQYGAHDGTDHYCAFASVPAFIAGYWRFIARPVYAGWQAYATDPAGFVGFLKSRGYAGDPDYVSKVLSILPKAQALLGEGGLLEPETGAPGTMAPVPAIGAGPAVVPEAEPDRPDRSELGESLEDILGAEYQPDFVTLSHISHAWQGRRPNGLEGAIVHYDAGRTRPKTGADDPEMGAKNTLRSGQSNGFAYVTISRSGKIYLPGNMDWNSWSYHAGQSRCPATGRESVSRYYVGFEVNCPGYVYPTDQDDVFVPWFDADRDAKGKVILDAKGRARVSGSGAETYRRSELRILKEHRGNIRAGAYAPFTEQQFRSLVAVLLWLKLSNRSTFRLDYVFGHDEVSPGRKIDPGASLGMPAPNGPGAAVTMRELRSMLLKEWADLQLLA